MDEKMLKAEMALKGYSISGLATGCNMSRSALIRKMKGQTFFTTNEVNKIMEVLEIDSKKMIDTFLNQSIQKDTGGEVEGILMMQELILEKGQEMEVMVLDKEYLQEELIYGLVDREFYLCDGVGYYRKFICSDSQLWGGEEPICKPRNKRRSTIAK